ncbi:MAG: hypothetical protein ACTSVF_01460 [Candidatus Asgardarchaeia archaeon]
MSRCDLCESRAEYLCKNCKSVFCERCLSKVEVEILVCSNCGSTEINKIRTEGGIFYSCAKCNSSEVRKAIKYVRKCPKCGSEVVKIDTFWRDLRDSFQSLMYKLEESFLKFKEDIKRMDELKERLLKVREMGFIHDSRLDKDIYDLYLKSKDTIGKTEKYLSKFDVNYFYTPNPKSYYIENPSELIKLEEDIKRLSEIFDETSSRLSDVLLEVESHEPVIDKRIYSIEYHYNLFLDYSMLIELEDDEYPICAIPNVRINLDLGGVGHKGNGILFITFKRLIFVDLKDKTSPVFNVRLNDVEVSSIKIVGRLNKRIRIPFVSGTLEIITERNTLYMIEQYLHSAYKVRLKRGPNLNLLKSIDLNPYIKSLHHRINTLIRGLKNRKMYGLKESKRGLRYEAGAVSMEAETKKGEEYTPLLIGNYTEGLTEPKEEPSRVEESAQEDERILNLESRKYAIEKSIEFLNDQLNSGMITYSDYLDNYKKLQGELFRINKKLQKMLIDKDKERS